MTRITSLTTAYSIFTSDKRQPKTSAVLIRDRNGVLIANSAGKIAIENAVLTLIDSLSSIVNLTIRVRHEKTCLRVSDQVRHKPGCEITEDG